MWPIQVFVEYCSKKEVMHAFQKAKCPLVADAYK
jgi:hypothetical protein